jgi:hypothetical protein
MDRTVWLIRLKGSEVERLKGKVYIGCDDQDSWRKLVTLKKAMVFGTRDEALGEMRRTYFVEITKGLYNSTIYTKDKYTTYPSSSRGKIRYYMRVGSLEVVGFDILADRSGTDNPRAFFVKVVPSSEERFKWRNERITEVLGDRCYLKIGDEGELTMTTIARASVFGSKGEMKTKLGSGSKVVTVSRLTASRLPDCSMSKDSLGRYRWKVPSIEIKEVWLDGHDK